MHQEPSFIYKRYNHMAQDYFGRPLSSTTISSYIQKCQLKGYCTKRKPYVNHVDWYQKQVHNPESVMVWGVRALGKGNLHFCYGPIKIFWSNICCLQDDIFSREAHVYFKTLQTTFCTHYKGIAWLAWPQSWPVPNKECVTHFKMQNVTTKTPYCHTP